MFWDIFGPLFLVIFVGLIVWAVIGFIQNDLYPLIVGAFAELLVCYMLGWSIGKLILIIPFTQLGLAGFMIFRKIKKLTESIELE